MKGSVKWFDVKKGYGFIVSPELVDDEGQSRDIFVHFTKIQMEGFKKLEQDEEVAFDLVTGDNGKPQAENVIREAA